MLVFFEKVISGTPKNVIGVCVVDTDNNKIVSYTKKQLVTATVSPHKAEVEAAQKQGKGTARYKAVAPTRQEIVNLYIEVSVEGKAVTYSLVGGDAGSLTRYPAITPSKEVYKDKAARALTVLSRTEQSEVYRVVQAPGKVVRVKKNELVAYGKSCGLTNAKLVARETGVVVSLLRGDILLDPEPRCKVNAGEVTPATTATNAPKAEAKQKELKEQGEQSAALREFTSILYKQAEVIDYLRKYYEKEYRSEKLDCYDSVARVCVDFGIKSTADIGKPGKTLDELLVGIRSYVDRGFSIVEWGNGTNAF